MKKPACVSCLSFLSFVSAFLPFSLANCFCRSRVCRPERRVVQLLEMSSSNTLSRTETWRLLVLVGVGVGILVNTFQGDGAPLIAAGSLSIIAFAITFSMIRWLGPVFIKAGLKGKDMAKPRKPEMYVHTPGVWPCCKYWHKMETDVRIQTRNNGSGVRCCLSSIPYCFHSLCFLQGHCSGHFRWWKSRCSD